MSQWSYRVSKIGIEINQLEFHYKLKLTNFLNTFSQIESDTLSKTKCFQVEYDAKGNLFAVYSVNCHVIVI